MKISDLETISVLERKFDSLTRHLLMAKDYESSIEVYLNKKGRNYNLEVRKDIEFSRTLKSIIEIWLKCEISKVVDKLESLGVDCS
jgi:phosphoribosyl-AMP cyclohydrolase